LPYNFVKNALKEDIGRGDLYSKVATAKPFNAKIISNSDGILAGVKYAKIVGELLNFEIKFLKNDGDAITSKDIIAELSGLNTDILVGERVVLNLLQHASGIATKTNKIVKLATPMKILDTRKTRPLLREFEKYATQIGGAVNHRFGLDDCLMIKDTHKKAIDNLQEFISMARQKLPFTVNIEIECETVDEAKQAMLCGADIVMCDNMSSESIIEVVLYRDANFKNIRLEASGGINELNIQDYAKTGVDAVSIGAIIHQAVWHDFSMK
jgi:nicotinate-nucleotide pyrophosphorylase (carboxylating)